MLTRGRVDSGSLYPASEPRQRQNEVVKTAFSGCAKSVQLLCNNVLDVQLLCNFSAGCAGCAVLELAKEPD